MRKVYLVGFMGCGKSAIGRRLSYYLKMPYYDMDQEIVRREKMTIPEIFEKYGEEHFRQLETDFLRNFRDEFCIISTGGGVAMNPQNRRIMRQTGLVLFLDATFPDIWKRIHKDKNRPIVQRSTKQELEDLFYKRRKFYREATHITIRTENRSLKQIVEYTAFQIKRLKGE
ncbi:shikimate kinase [Viridibacillus sp. FSL R5-0477]|uniref:Shikimate kinase n=1 Tax=Viridibacillus arenosi FSL R5-213 TaxID=1227360 RepID=W4ENT8_9BACL|nr:MULTISPECIES: shikimate kinase [Viridibacillus]ETT82240.1 shikimate kinase [Viridibacillus arenosi FSL R5-213]OMC83685.1 shikimate kinase [Viridibacillus sp. FSL H7-0596]OMC85242.1 shikimate kinase [Viridibacillus sp. FSL H8-0123]OMC92654.1 shikimate kinase [Viridibacillus arenosi]